MTLDRDPQALLELLLERASKMPMGSERRAPIQGEYIRKFGAPTIRIPKGTIAWTEHEECWRAYAAKFGRSQSAEVIAERQGFGVFEFVKLVGREPTTWRPW